MSLHKLDFEEASPTEPSGDKLGDDYFNMVKDVEVEVTATIGTTNISINELFNLENNSILTLKQMVDEPIDLSLNGKLIGRGELVASGDNFAIRILEIKNNMKP